MENIIKKVIDIENSAKDRVNEIKDKQQKYIDDCRVEFDQIKQSKYDDINSKIELYKKEQNETFVKRIQDIVSYQEKINNKLVEDFNNDYDKLLQDLYEKITG